MRIYWKPSLILGAIIGAIYGLVLALPFIQCMACFGFIFIGAIVVVYLKKKQVVGILSVQDGAIIGAISGFSAMVAASAVCIPVQSIINLFNKSGINFFSSFWVTSFSLLVIPMIVFFMAALSALFNSFSGLSAAFVYEKIENISLNDQSEIVIDQE